MDWRKKRKWLYGIAVGALFLFASEVHRSQAVEVDVFRGVNSSGGLSPEWRPLTFPKIPNHTRYSLVKEEGRWVIRAESRASASMLYKSLEADPKLTPLLRWEWKIGNLLKNSDPTQKRGDDYPARIYVAFKNKTALNYIWESKFPKGKILPNPYRKEVRMLIVESGEEKVGTWVKEERNLLEDYRQAFGQTPPSIIGIALMTDTDNTGEAASASYAEITLSSR
jgi:hypothetical protein